MTTNRTYDTFLSYNSVDKPVVEALAHHLTQAGIHPWLDTWNVIPGDPWQEAIEQALDACPTCAVCIGPSGTGPWQNEQMRAAIERRVYERPNGYRVIPVLLPGAERGERSKLPMFLAATTWVEFRQALDDEEAFHRLVAGIRGQEPGPRPGATGYSGTSPYRGLQVFDVDDSSFFFGREALSEWLLDALRPVKSMQPENRFLGIIGPSGSGKSSLARAGFMAAIKQGKLPGSQEWPVVICKPGVDPLESLAVALCTVPGVGEHVTAVRDLIRDLREDANTLHVTTRWALRHASPDHRLVVLVDQFEELWTLCHNDAVRTATIDTLMHAATVVGGQTLVILALRADFYGKCAAYPELAAALSDHQVLVGPMTRDELRRAIERPAQITGCEFEPGLIELLVDDVSGQPGGLPLLQYALLELWKRRVGRTFTHAAYYDIGGVEGALEQRAEMVYAAFDVTQQAICQRIFLRLTQPGEGTEDTRRRATVHELIPSAVDMEAFNTVLWTLSGPEARLITGQSQIHDSDEAHHLVLEGHEVVEVAHEALIRSWSRLRSWLDENRAALRVHRQITEAAQEWIGKDHDPSYLYQGARLTEAQEWATTHADDLNEEERTFLQASRVARDERLLQETARKAHEAALERRSRWVLRALVAVFLGATVVALTFVWRTRHELEITNAHRLALAAQSQMSNAPETALLLAQEAVMRYHDLVTEQALRDALDQVPWAPTVLTGHTDVVGRAMFSPDGQRIVTASDDGTARLWDLNGQLLMTFKGHTRAVQGAEFSPDGQRIVTASEDGTARLWDLNGQSLMIFDGHTDVVQSALFSPDGQRIVTASDDGTARLWDLNGQSIATLKGHTGMVQSALFSPDGQRIVTASEDKTARLWDVNGQSLTMFNGHTDVVQRAEFSPDGQRVLTASDDGTVRLWDFNGQSLTTFKGHTGGVQRAKFSPDGQRVLTASLDETARLWDSNGQSLATLKGHTDRVTRANFSPDGQYILTASVDQTARLWDLSGQQLAAFTHTAKVGSAMFSPDGQRILTTSVDHTARVWNRAGPPLATLTGHTKALNTALFSPDGQRILTSSSDKTARLWDLSGQQLAIFQGHTDEVSRARFSPDGQHVLTASDDRTVRLWDLHGRLLTTFKNPNEEMFVDAVSPDGRYVVTASDDGTGWLWDLSGQLVAPLKGHTKTILTALFSPNGQYIVTTSDDTTARVWNLSGQPVATLSGHTQGVIRAAFSLDGQQIVTVSDDKTARLWDLSGQQHAIFQGHTDRVVRAVISPDRQRVLTISRDATARLWDISGEQLEIFSHTGRVIRAAFSPDGQQIVTAEADSTAQLWSVSGQLLATFPGHTDALETAVFSPDGKRILTASNDGTARQYLVNVEDVLAFAACRVGRSLTNDEMARFEVDRLRFHVEQRQCPPAVP